MQSYKPRSKFPEKLDGRQFLIATLVFANLAIGSTCYAMISVGFLNKEDAKAKYGITMHARPNGDAGVKVWLEFKKEGLLKDFTYAEFQLNDDKGKHLVSAVLQPNPVHHQQAADITSVAFSADESQLANCNIMVVCYGSNEGDVGYILPVKDFIDLQKPITEKLDDEND
jgi:hypothetical protein